MTKCPKGTPSQVKANFAHLNKASHLVLNGSSWGHDLPTGQMLYEEKEAETPPESDELELDSNKADKRNPPTARDELVYFFINYFLDMLLESWEGKPCIKRKLDLSLSVLNESEMYGEDLGPCEPSIVLSTVDYLKDLYQKRTFNLSKEKFKKGSYSTESEYLNEEDFESSPPELWKTFEPDEDVHFVFLNGVWYKGRVSRRMMEGEGFYFWEDGTTYQGEFEGGCVTGRGRLEFPDLSVYEGGVYKAFRHGEGIFCFSESPVMYTGQWWLGKKHGQGLIMYSDPSESQNFYRGQWQDGFKEGFGFRQYPSGAKYIGFWSNGKQHGRGAMFWNNHDIYRGDWKEGQMHGYGEYTWNGFVNKSLSYPAHNTYRGYWSDGKRNGKGLFELKSGSLIETIWVENMKEGSGVVVCKNGFVVVSEKLFMKDKPGTLITERNDVGVEYLKDSTAKLVPSNESENRMTNMTLEKKSPTINDKAISIPIHLPVHTLNLVPHIYKYSDQKKKKIIKGLMESDWELYLATMTSRKKATEQKMTMESKYSLTNAQISHITECNLQEEKHLRNFITFKMSALRACYDHYATLACENPPSFKCVLLRMFLWQMLIDGEVPRSNLSLIDIDCILASEDYLLIENPHDPFERILFWQFIQSLITLSWHLYGQYISGELPLLPDDRTINFLQYFEKCECKSVLKIAFEYFTEKNVFIGRFQELTPPPSQGNKFEEGDLAPMEAIYLIYCSVGEPHSARDFVNAICQAETECDWRSCIVRYFEKLPFYKVEGRNALTVAGELQHIPGQKPFNFPEIFQLEENKTQLNPKSELTCFKGLKAKRVIKCLMEVCPGIMNDGFVVNMDYQLTFLEFYRTIILCIKLQLKIKIMNTLRDDITAEYKIELEEYNRRLDEIEKLRENSGLSRKKSRQFPPDFSKKGKK